MRPGRTDEIWLVVEIALAWLAPLLAGAGLVLAVIGRSSWWLLLTPASLALYAAALALRRRRRGAADFFEDL